AGIMFAGLPFLWFFVKQKRPEYYGLLPDGAEVEGEAEETSQMIDRGVEYATNLGETEFTLRQAMKTRSYWMLFAAWASEMVIMGSITIHFIPFLTDMGIDQTVAGSMMAVMVFFTVPSRFLGGFLADRFRKDRMQFLLVGAVLFQAVGITAILLNQTIAIIYVFLILYGFGSGATTPLKLTMQGRYFGRKAFASILGSFLLFTAPASLVAPIYAGWIYDTTGSYITAFIGFAALATLATFLICLARPPKPPAQVTDIRNFV
ncbi:MFS transporter, partial [Chloroflexota bacterium]